MSNERCSARPRRLVCRSRRAESVVLRKSAGLRPRPVCAGKGNRGGGAGGAPPVLPPRRRWGQQRVVEAPGGGRGVGDSEAPVENGGPGRGQQEEEEEHAGPASRT